MEWAGIGGILTPACSPANQEGGAEDETAIVYP